MTKKRKKVRRVVLGEGCLMIEDGYIFQVINKEDVGNWGCHWRRRYPRNTVRLVAEVLE